MTTADYLEQLEQDREDLVDNLETKGITGLTGDETFTELVPEVLNISGEPEPKNTNELNNYIKSARDYFNTNIYNIPDSYTPLSTESTTLYSPATDYVYYVIQKRASGKYRCAWYKQIVGIDSVNMYNCYIKAEQKTSSNLINTYFDYNADYYPNNITPPSAYFSQELNTVEEVIQKMKSNQLTYTEYPQGILAYVAVGNSIFPCSNAIIFDIPTGNNIIPASRISTNENIVVIN